MKQASVINTILIPGGMEAKAESIRAKYVEYFQKKKVSLALLFTNHYQERAKTQSNM